MKKSFAKKEILQYFLYGRREKTRKKPRKSENTAFASANTALKLHTDHVTSAQRCHKIGISQEGALQCATKGT